MNALSAFAYDPNDTDAVRLEKAAILLISVSSSLLGGYDEPEIIS